MHDFGARMYDPVLGRWHSMDPASQYASPYIGIGNNPINLIDPNGELSIGAIMWGLALFGGMGPYAGGFIGGSRANDWELNFRAWEDNTETRKGIRNGVIIGAAIGATFAFSATCIFYGTMELVFSWQFYAAGIPLAKVGTTCFDGVSNIHWSTPYGGGGEISTKPTTPTGGTTKDILNDMNKWKQGQWEYGFYGGSYYEAKDLLIAISKINNCEAIFYTTDKGYYFESLEGKSEQSVFEHYDGEGEIIDIRDHKYIIYEKNSLSSSFGYSAEYRDGNLYVIYGFCIPMECQIKRMDHTHPKNTPPISDNDLKWNEILPINAIGWDGVVRNIDSPVEFEMEEVIIEY